MNGIHDMLLTRPLLLLALAACAAEPRGRSDAQHREGTSHPTGPHDAAAARGVEAGAVPTSATSAVDFGRERALIDQVQSAMKPADYPTARAKAAEVVALLLARPQTERDAAWVELLISASRVASSTGDLRTARLAGEQVLEILTRTLPDEHPDLQAARHTLAVTIGELGDLAGARALEQQALEARSRTLPEDHLDLQAARQNFAVSIMNLGDRAGARALFEQVLEVLSRTVPDDHPDLQRARGNVAVTVKGFGDLVGARALEEKVLEVRSRTLSEDHPDLQRARGNLAATLSALGDLVGARTLEQKVLEARSRTLPEDHPELQTARHNLATTLGKLGDFAGARALEEKVLEVYLRTLPEDHPYLQATRQTLALSLKKLGDVKTARSLEERVLEVRTRTLPEEHPDLQAARQNLAVTLRKLGDTKTARSLEERVLEVRTRTLPEEHPDLQAARQNLAVTLKELGDTKTARSLEERVLEVRTRTLPGDHPDLQWSRFVLATTLAKLGDFAGARVLLERTLEVRTRTLTADHPDLQATRQNLAVMLKELGDLQGARVLWEQVLEVRTRTLRNEHPDLQRARLSLAGILRELGDLVGAKALFEKVLDVCLSTLPDEHPDLQTARQNLAVTLMELGDQVGAKALFEKVLDVRLSTLPDEHGDLLTTRMYLAAALGSMHDYHGSRPLLEKVLEVLSRTRPEDDLDLQMARSNLGATMCPLGDFAGARALFERVLEVGSRTLPEEHRVVLAARENLAVTLKALGDFGRARALEEQVLEVRSRALPDEHPDLQRSRLNLAATIRALGDYSGSLALQRRVFEIRSRVLPDEHPELQQARLDLAATIKRLGYLEGARALEEKVLEIASRTLPEAHPDLLFAQGQLAVTLRVLGDLDGARTLGEKLLDQCSRAGLVGDANLQAARENLAWTIATQLAVARRSAAGEGGGGSDRVLGSQRCIELMGAVCQAHVRAAREAILGSPSREAEERCSVLAWALGHSVSFAQGLGVLEPSHELAAESFALSEATRGAAIACAEVTRRAARSPEYRAVRGVLRASSDELALLAQQGATREEFDRALRKREAAERGLVALARGIPGERGVVDWNVESLAASLGEGESAVGFRRLAKWRLNVADGLDSAGQLRVPGSKVESLCAFVVRSARAGVTPDNPSPLTLIDFGPIAPIESAAKAWRKAIGVGVERGQSPQPERRTESLQRGEELRRLLFDPLLAALGNANHLILALDDVAHLVPFDVLPLKDGEGLVGDRWRIETRATLSELMAPAPAPTGTALLALGGASFNLAPLPLTTEEAAATSEPWSSAQAPLILRGTAWERGFGPLTHAADEARGIGALYGEAFESGRPAIVLERRKASREALTELAPKARYVHIATHGWFAPESIRSWNDPEPLDKYTGQAWSLSREEQIREMSPMLLCGLALAGANLTEDALGRVPGLVTAEELSTIDLTNCELAVLSACDTNVGERRAGQGVASLQKALHMAGARSVITSLWRVPDEATKELMLDFYRRLWVEKKPKWQALWEAKLMLRNAKDENGQPRYTLRDWGAWVLTGEPE